MARYEIKDGVGIIPQGTTRIADSAFSDQAWLDSKELVKIIVPDTVTSIGDSAFLGCENLTSILIPNSVKTIGEYAFYGCKKLVSVIIPNSVTEIGQAAFECCSSLKTITLPASVTKIGISMFYYCYALEAIYVPKSKIDYFKELLSDYKDFIQADPRSCNGSDTLCTKIKDNMEEYNFEACIDALKKSSMFHFSLGSKELFHSNFLHWLSETDWNFFVNIMRCLAGHKDSAFWWEKYKDKIKVHREFKHFDLSIWLLDNKGDEEEPVLILENKVKTLPYKEQLKKYVDDAYELWKKGQIVKEIIENDNGESINDKCGITFILLSLILPENFEKVEVKKTYKLGRKKTDKEYEISFSWSNNTYQALLDAFHDNNYEPENANRDLFKKILEDYSSFVSSLLKIARNDWKISDQDEYLMKICPQDIKDGGTNCETKHRKEKIKKLEELRIADIRQKICYEQLLDLLMRRLEGICVRRVESQDLGYNKKKGNFANCFLCRTNFFHKKGLFEAIYLIRKKQSRDDEPFFLTIQIQGNLYMHGISGKNVVIEDDGCNKLGEFFTIDSTFIKNKNKIGKFFDYKKNDPDLLKKKNLIFDDNSFGKYGPNFIYQAAKIPLQMTISDLLELMVNDIESIKKLWPIK